MKKLIAIATALSVAVMVAGPGTVEALTAAELQTQITALLAQIQQLQTQLAGMGGGTAVAACTGITSFATNLTQGSSGADVKCLQALLNQSADTQVATTGAGSPGNETTYFGALTKAAVAKYQVKKAISPTAGYFGPLTRASMNPLLLAGGVSPTPTATPPAGCTSATEGSYTVTLSSTPVGGTVNAGAGVEVYGVDVRAINSDITVGRVDLQAAVVNATTAVAEAPSNFISTIKVYDTSVSAANLKRTYTAPVFTQDTAARWYTQLTDFNVVVPVNTTKKVLLVVDTVTSIDQNRTVTLNVYGNGIRGRDCRGIDSYQALATTRVFTFQQPGVATLTISTASDNPNTNMIQADVNNGVQTKETLLSLNAKATAGPTTLIRFDLAYATVAGGGVLASTSVPSIFYLYDGDTMVSSCTPAIGADAVAGNAGTCTFENFLYPIAENVVKNFKIKANWAASALFDGGGSTVATAPLSTAALAQGGVHQRANGQQVGIVTAAAIASNPIIIASNGLNLTFVSGATPLWTPLGQTASVGSVSGTIVFKAKPFGGALVEPAYTSQATTVGAVVTSGMLVRMWPIFDASEMGEMYQAPFLASATSYTISQSLSASPSSRNIADGEEVTITVNTSIAMPLGPSCLAGNIRFKVHDVCYNVGGTLACLGQGSGAVSGGRTGNITDSWVTNWLNLPQ